MDKATAGSIPNLPDQSLMPVQSKPLEVDNRSAIWYLGIDLGTTGVSCVLLNYMIAQRYPIYWPKELLPVNSALAAHTSSEVCFRLPTVTYSNPVSKDNLAKETYPIQLSGTAFAIGSLASKLAKTQPGLFLENFKPYLNLGIPYYCPKRYVWEPTLQLYGQQLVSLYQVRQTLQALLTTLIPQKTWLKSPVKVGAIGLNSETLERALSQLAGVILSIPASWDDTYRFNVREAVLATKLVRHPEQIFFLEDAIAGVLAKLPTTPATPMTTEDEESRTSLGQNRQTFSQTLEKDIASITSPASADPLWQGTTFAIDAGATTTELALVNLPDNLEDLTYSDFSLCSWSYAGNAIDQDIFCQLLYPQLTPEQQQQLLLTTDLELPQPGQADPQKREYLAWLLQHSPLGQALLKASGYLKVILQRKQEFTLELGSDCWVVKRRDLETRVIEPFLQQLNRELNNLLIKTGLLEQGICQVICMGGTSNLDSLQKWLQRKLPNATLIRENPSKGGSFIANGLANFPLYPQVLNRSQHQYSDYFLILELLRTFPQNTGHFAERGYKMGEIMQLLERRGLNTSTCYERLVRIVEGELPSGLVPSSHKAIWLSQDSQQNPYYSTVTASGLFFQEEPQVYRPNLQQQECLRQYLDLLLFGTSQKFKDPLPISLLLALR